MQKKKKQSKFGAFDTSEDSSRRSSKRLAASPLHKVSSEIHFVAYGDGKRVLRQVIRDTAQRLHLVVPVVGVHELKLEVSTEAMKVQSQVQQGLLLLKMSCCLVSPTVCVFANRTLLWRRPQHHRLAGARRRLGLWTPPTSGPQTLPSPQGCGSGRAARCLRARCCSHSRMT